MYDVNKVDAEKFVYAFTGMSLSKYAELLIKEFRIEAESMVNKEKSYESNQEGKTVIRECVYSNDQEMLYTVAETAKLLKTNPTYVYSLIKAGLLPVLKLGSYKIRKQALIEFLEKHEGKDLSDPGEIKDIQF